MTTISIDDTLINEAIAISHCQNPQEAVAKILVDYLAQKKQANIAELLAMPNAAAINFKPPRFSERWLGQFKLNADVDDARLAYLIQRYQI